MSALGGQIEAMVRTSPECAWSATTNATWLQVQPASGQGEVAITLQVAENKLPNERIGAIHVNGLDVMLAQVVQVERPHQLGDLAAPRVGDVIKVGGQVQDLVLGLVEVAGRGLGDGQRLDQVVEEPHVQMALRALDRQVVELR